MNSVPTTPGHRCIENTNGSRSVETGGRTHLKRRPYELCNNKRKLASSAPRASSALPKDGDFTVIDEMDVNKMFDSGKGIIKMNRSPIKIDLSSPGLSGESVDRVIPDPKRLKLELALAPNLSQPEGGIGTIEMLDFSGKNSPQKEDDEDVIELEEVIKESKKNHDSIVATPNTDDKVNSTLELQRLTPVMRKDDQGEKNDTPARELFCLISKRNEELVMQLHHLNQSINEVINSCDSTVGNYRRQFDELKQNYASELDAQKRELASVLDDCTAFKEKFDVAKRKVNETRDEVKMLNQNQSILKNKYEGATSELEECKRKSSELEEENSKLKSEFSENNMKVSKLEEVYQESLRRVQSLLDERCESNRKIDKLNLEMNIRNQEYQKLEVQLQETSAAHRGSRDEKTKQLEELVIHKDQLESRISELHLQLHSLETELKSIKRTVVVYEDNEVRLRDELESKQKDCHHWQKNYETVNDDVEILKAEVKELYSDIDEHKELKAHLENSVAQLEQEVNDWRRKDEDRHKDHEKLLLELDSIHLKYNNTEREHLLELEQLHDNLSSLQSTLKKDSELISQLTRKNEYLESELKSHSPNQNLQNLREEVDSWKEKYRNKELEFSRSLKLLAEDLYIQYSSKHEQKVKLLKKGYESKYENKLEKLSLQNKGLEQEVNQLKSQLLIERKEKQKVIGLLESQRNENESPT